MGRVAFHSFPQRPWSPQTKNAGTTKIHSNQIQPNQASFNRFADKLVRPNDGRGFSTTGNRFSLTKNGIRGQMRPSQNSVVEIASVTPGKGVSRGGFCGQDQTLV